MLYNMLYIYTTIEGIEGLGLYIQCKLDICTRVYTYIPYITVGLHGYRYNITIILYIIFDVSTNKYNYVHY